MLEDRAGNMWVGVDDGLYLFKNGRFRRLPEPNHKPLGLVVGIAEDSDGNIWAECAGNPRKLVRIRDFQVREEFPASQVPTGRTLAPDPQGGIWIGTLNGDIALFRHGVLKTFPLNAKGDPFIRQIIASGDGSVLAGSADGLVGVRQGKVQRMTTKNGLPCNFVTSFIQDREKRWWLYTDCGIVELPDSELQRWWANPEADRADPRLRRIGWSPGRATGLQFRGVLFGWARVVCQRSLGTDGGPVSTLAKGITGGDDHRICHRRSKGVSSNRQPQALAAPARLAD